MKSLKALAIKLSFVTIPLLLLYMYAQIAFKANREKEHPTDVGMGIVVYWPSF